LVFIWNWLLLGESVTSHGRVDSKRHAELARAGPSWADTLAKSPWETEVWVADAPSHLIHFNGVRFLVPYPERTSGARRLHSFRLIVKS